MKKVILFDIDKTIFDNEKFIQLKDEKIIDLLKIKNINEYKNIFKNYYSSLKNTRDFDHIHFINLVCKKYGYKNSKLLIKETYDNSELYVESLYSDVIDALDNLKENYSIGIFSEGKNKFQNFKFNSLGISKYIDKDLIFIVDAKDTQEVIDKLPKGCVIVDDKESICNFLTENGIRVIWINRKDDRKSEKYQTVFSLTELPAIL